MASVLTKLVKTLLAHLPESKPRRMPYSVENVARAISEQAAHIRKKQEHSGIDQLIRASEDELDIIGCYRNIEHIFRQLQIDITLSNWELSHDQWVDTRLKDLNPIHDARHNAGLSMEMQRHGCTQNTRVRVLKEAMDWTRNSDVAKIYWMSGMAGTGKTTIAYTLCEQLEESKQLGASFFCSRGSRDCRDVNKIVPTIAYQLARFSNPYQKELCDVLSNNPDVSKREISVQFQKLILAPLSTVRDAMPRDVVIVIDALDECSDARGTQMVLDLLFRHATSFPVKFFVTSRPEPGISSRIAAMEDTYRCVLHLHDVEESLVREDIRTYLEEELKSIGVKSSEIDRLTSRAGRLFIFAATVVRYIDPTNAAVDHRKRLTTMLRAHTTAEMRAYRELDELYIAILRQSIGEEGDEENQLRRSVLRAVLSAKEPLSVATIAELTGLESEGVQLALLPLHSVLRVSPEKKVISTLHASFPDFMMNSARSGEFYCDMSEQNAYMATRCFEIMKKFLKFNICNLETSSQADQDIPDLEARVNEAISSGLSYASRYWGDHLYGARPRNELTNMLDEFLQHRLLHWMEVLNLKDWIGFAAAILLQAFKYLPGDDSLNQLREMIQDSRNFVTAYAVSPVSLSTPHIYISALPLVSMQSFIRKTYWPRMKELVQLEGPAIKYRGDAALATWAVGLWVSKLAFSKDGRRMASGAADGSITVWDFSNGRRLLGPLNQHQDIVYAIAFSPDGTRVASGSYDSKIYIWNSDSGDTLPVSFEGHTRSITGLIFSLDGAHLISSSEDRTIRIWNSSTGSQIGSALTGHEDCVMSIVLSSDGRQLVSSSDDHTIRVWDLKTGTTVIGPLKGHTDWVDCIELSPDNKYIVSSSRDCTVRVWSIEQGKTVVGPLTGHSDRVYSVSYSPDGKKIVSGGYDQTIRVWNSETGELIAGPFRQEGAVFSVLFSLDSTQVISGSSDGTIRIWDANHSVIGANTESGDRISHNLSIALSSDGARVVSASSDYTIYVWDTQDGTLILGPLTGHTDSVQSVACTPDGTCIVSGSMDRTIRTWDARTGLALADPFTGHADGVNAVSVSPDGKLVVSGSADYSIKIWDLKQGLEVIHPSVHHTGWVRTVDFSPNGSYIASGSDDTSVCLWDVQTGALIRKLEQHTSSVTSVAFSPDNRKIVSCSTDQTVLQWDVDTGAVLTRQGHSSGLWAVSFSPDGSMIASGASDGTISLWDAEKGTALATPFRGHTTWVYSIVFTPESNHIVSGSWDGTIRFWDLNNISIDNAPHQEIGYWVDNDGWIRNSESQLVLWLPSDLKLLILIPSCSFLISSQGSVQANFGKFIYGDRWAECYAIPSDSDTSGSSL
ncbi:hypothetical protein OPQ81_002128 [Rhizoctonia solani]|nr:hypothetical protein OPQ81_002128 [Rhizoctonia solani]